MSERDPIRENPFHILELAADCGPMEVERAGARLAGLLELGVKRAKTYATPLGEQPRTAEGVREAIAALGDPNDRLFYELWATVEAAAAAGSAGQGAGGEPPLRVSWWKR